MEFIKTQAGAFARAALIALGASALVACNPAPAPTPTLEGEIDLVIGIGFPIESAILGETRIVNVWLPHGYEQRNQDFPVVYLIDGGMQQDFLPVAGFGSLAWLSGQYQEFIVVGVQTNNRRWELTTPSEVAYDLQQIPNNGGADDFRRFIVEEVQPIINDTYRTNGETTVLGESLAGFFIVDTLLRAPDSFDNYIAVSPSVWWQEMALANNAGQYLQAAEFPTGKQLYLTNADEVDIGEAIIPLVAALEADAPVGLDWWYDPMPQEHHNTIYHPATLKALRWIFGTDPGPDVE